MTDHISICICTFRRNRMLGRLLRSLKNQDTEGLFDYSFVVVDNDAAGQAGETVARLRAELGLSIDYDIEPENTIPAARNRALGLARGNYIGIIDDDEFAPQHWLITLYRTIQRYGVDGGLGPVYPFYRQKPPDWVLKGRFGERPVIPTGTLLNWDQTRTGNVLLRRDVFDRHHLRFDLRWKTSGSDRAFFKVAIAAGYKFIAVKEAPVYETVPPMRWKESYYLRRAIVQGYNTHKNAANEIHGMRRITIPLKLAAASGIYALALPFALGMGTHIYVKVLERGGHHLSRLFAMLGIELVKKRDF
jgi:glycosyltransferase involved in cell wall biosynthesis